MLQGRTARDGRRDAGGGLLRSAQLKREEEEGDGEKWIGLRERKRAASTLGEVHQRGNAWSRRRCCRWSAWARAYDAAGEQVAQETGLNSFDSILTQENSKFYTTTRILAKTKIVEEVKIYNFDIRQNLIWNSNQEEKRDWTQLKVKYTMQLN